VLGAIVLREKIARGRITARLGAVPVKQIKLPSESVRADLCLGLTVTGLYTLITMGLIILFM
jgi:hypothetical protein